MTQLKYCAILIYIGPIAQWLEHPAHNRQVLGSSPSGSTKYGEIMDIEFKNTEVEDANEVLDEVVESTNELKKMLVNYVGEKQTPDGDNVTVEMIVEQLADEFPEFVLAVAEENFIRGYQQALSDVEVGRKAWEEEQEKNEQE